MYTVPLNKLRYPLTYPYSRLLVTQYVCSAAKQTEVTVKVYLFVHFAIFYVARVFAIICNIFFYHCQCNVVICVLSDFKYGCQLIYVHRHIALNNTNDN